MQPQLVPIQIINEFPSSGSSADLSRIGVGDDGNQYALKTLGDSPFLPISEWVGYHLCHALRIKTPDFAAVKMIDGSLAFGSLWDFSLEQFPKFPTPVDFVNFFAPLKDQIAEIYAVDVFLPNEDRHGRNFLFRRTALSTFPLAFDFSRAWLMLGLPFGKELTAPCNTLNWWNYLKQQLGLLPALHILDEIEQLPDNWLEGILNLAPASWTASFDVSKCVDFWQNERQVRRRHAQGLL